MIQFDEHIFQTGVKKETLPSKWCVKPRVQWFKNKRIQKEKQPGQSKLLQILEGAFDSFQKISPRHLFNKPANQPRWFCKLICKYVQGDFLWGGELNLQLLGLLWFIIPRKHPEN